MAWYCDSCLSAISDASHGRIEWISLYAGTPGGRDLRLVHDLVDATRVIGGCQFNAREEFARDKGKVNGAPLSEFLGPDGLMRLLGLMAVDGLPRDAVLEMIKRLHVPGYEDARSLLRSYVSESGMAVISRSYYPTQLEITSTLSAAMQRGGRDSGPATSGAGGLIMPPPRAASRTAALSAPKGL